jgi:putative phage-type endonuclease
VSAITEHRTAAGVLLGVFEQDSPEWHAARLEGVGGSDVVAILGMSKWQGSTPYGVWEDKTGRARPLPMTWPLFRGHADEQKLRDWFTHVTGIMVETTGTWMHRDNSWMRVNPDGLTGDGGGFEAKSHSWRMGEEWTDEQVSDAAELQAQWGMAVTGLDHWWVVAQIGQDEPLIRRVERDDALIAVLIDVAGRFWHEHVLPDLAPPAGGLDLDSLKDQWRTDLKDATDGDPAEYEPLIRDLEKAKADIKEAEARKADIEAALRQKAGAAQVVQLDGQKRLSLVRNGPFAPAKFTADHPDLAAQYMTTAPVLDVTRLRKERPETYDAYRARVLRVHTPKEK